MATAFPLVCPLRRGDSVNALAGITRSFSGGNNLAKNTCARLASAATGTLYGSRKMPGSLDNSQTTKFRAVCVPDTNGAAGNKLRLEVSYRVLAMGDSIDFASWQQTVANLVDVAAWTAKNTYLVEFTVTSTNFSANSLVEYQLQRNKGPADDTLGANVFIADFDLLASI